MGLYCCRKIRLYGYLIEQGFKPVRAAPDKWNSERLVWLFEDKDGSVRDAVESYYDSIPEKV